MQTNPSEKCDVCESYRGNPPPHVCVNSQLRPRSDSQPVVPEWKEKIEKSIYTKFGAATMLVSMADGNITDAVIKLRDSMINEVLTIALEVRNATLEQAAEALENVKSGGTELVDVKIYDTALEDAQTTIRQLKSK